MDPSNVKNTFTMPMLTEENYPRWRQLFFASMTLRGWEKTLKKEVLPVAEVPGRTAEQAAVEEAAATVAREALEEAHRKGLAMMMMSVDPLWYSILASKKYVWEALELLDEQYRGNMSARQDALREQLFNLRKQDDQSILEYMLTVNQIRTDLALLGETFTDGAVITNVLKGLPDEYNSVKEKLRLNREQNLMTVKTILSRQEQLLEEREEKLLRTDTSKSAFLSWQREKMIKQQKGQKAGASSSGEDQTHCYKCGEKGHKKSACPMRKDKFNGPCYTCGFSGHKATECPNSGAGTSNIGDGRGALF